ALELQARKGFVEAFDFLQTKHVGTDRCQIIQQVPDPLTDGIDVPSRDAQKRISLVLLAHIATRQAQRGAAAAPTSPARAIGRSQSCEGSARSRPLSPSRDGLRGRAGVGVGGRLRGGVETQLSRSGATPDLSSPTREGEIAFTRLRSGRRTSPLAFARTGR